MRHAHEAVAADQRHRLARPVHAEPQHLCVVRGEHLAHELEPKRCALPLPHLPLHHPRHTEFPDVNRCVAVAMPRVPAGGPSALGRMQQVGRLLLRPSPLLPPQAPSSTRTWGGARSEGRGSSMRTRAPQPPMPRVGAQETLRLPKCGWRRGVRRGRGTYKWSPQVAKTAFVRNSTGSSGSGVAVSSTSGNWGAGGGPFFVTLRNIGSCSKTDVVLFHILGANKVGSTSTCGSLLLLKGTGTPKQTGGLRQSPPRTPTVTFTGQTVRLHRCPHTCL